MKKRHELPAFKKIDMNIDVERIIEEIRNMQNFILIDSN